LVQGKSKYFYIIIKVHQLSAPGRRETLFRIKQESPNQPRLILKSSFRKKK